MHLSSYSHPLKKPGMGIDFRIVHTLCYLSHSLISILGFRMKYNIAVWKVFEVKYVNS